MKGGCKEAYIQAKKELITAVYVAKKAEEVKRFKNILVNGHSRKKVF